MRSKIASWQSIISTDNLGNKLRTLSTITLKTVLLAALVFSCLAHAAEPYRSPFNHTAWTKRDGAPVEIKSITRSDDGWLWIASPSGLYRFDGVQFERMDSIDGNRLPSSNVHLLLGYDGGLMVSYQFGGLSFFKDGKVTHFSEKDGLPQGSVQLLNQAPDGTVWLLSTTALAYYKDGHWQQVESASRHNPPEAHTLQFAPSGKLWLFVGDGLYTIGERGQLVRELAIDGMVDGRVTGKGEIWFSNGTSALQQYDPATKKLARLALPKRRPGDISLFTTRGNELWAIDSGKVMAVRQQQPVAERLQPLLAASAVLSGKSVRAFFEDKEGIIWFGTTGGLDRLRPNRLHEVGAHPNWGPSSLVEGDDNTMVASATYDKMRVTAKANGPTIIETGPNVTASARTPDGGNWMAYNAYLWRSLHGHEQQKWPLPQEMQGYHVQALADAGDGAAWVSVIRNGVFLFRDGKWLRNGGLVGLPQDPAVSLAKDPQGRLWIGYTGNRIAMVDGTKVTMYDERQGLDIGNVLSLYHGANRMWAGGETGIAMLHEGRFFPLKDKSGNYFRGISGLVEAANGDLWLHGTEGLTRIDAVAARRNPADLARGVDYERFDYLDGLQGAAIQIRPLPTLVPNSDGKIWYATTEGMGWIDPDHIPRNRVPPHVMIRGLRTDRASYDSTSGRVLPENTSNLRIDFTATALAMPERVRFKYKLSGVDDDWRDPGATRSAFYTSLAPGSYRFQVLAANEDGVWNEQGATVSFRILPTFLQSNWFKVICILAAATLLYLAYLMRIAQVSAKFRAEIQARQHERERIARALHDTLLQGVQSLTVRAQGAINELPPQAPVRVNMEAILDSADQMLVDGRDQVMDMRARMKYVSDLRATLKSTGTSMAQEFGVKFGFSADGLVQPTQAVVNDDIYCIAREALSNAFRHASAQRVEVHLNYGSETFALHVRDDGLGIDDAVLDAGGRHGHWGLTGMRERAQGIGGKLDIWSSTGKGTEVVLTLPSESVYTGAVPSKPRRWFDRYIKRRRN
jgi:signal transduction histidine kinase/ligand-binding sensor domain-containing protein